MTKQIPLSRGLFATVDDADYQFLMQWRWRIMSAGYAGRRDKNKSVLMHRVIINAPTGMFVDHIDGDRLNNTRANLRICTPKENLANQKSNKRRSETSSQYKGVSWDSRLNRWRASANSKYIGVFKDEVEAAKAYDYRARQEFGVFARVNFPLPGEQSALT